VVLFEQTSTRRLNHEMHSSCKVFSSCVSYESYNAGNEQGEVTTVFKYAIFEIAIAKDC